MSEIKTLRRPLSLERLGNTGAKLLGCNLTLKQRLDLLGIIGLAGIIGSWKPAICYPPNNSLPRKVRTFGLGELQRSLAGAAQQFNGVIQCVFRITVIHHRAKLVTYCCHITQLHVPAASFKVA